MQLLHNGTSAQPISGTPGLHSPADTAFEAAQEILGLALKNYAELKDKAGGRLHADLFRVNPSDPFFANVYLAIEAAHARGEPTARKDISRQLGLEATDPRLIECELRGGTDAFLDHWLRALEDFQKTLRATKAAQELAAALQAGESPKEAIARTMMQLGDVASQGWEEPGPLDEGLLPVRKFNAKLLLPDGLRAWVADEAERMPCPIEYVAAAALVSLGAAVGARCALKPKALDDWAVVPNLWGAIVGNPSAKKSPAMAAGLAPLNALAAAAEEDCKEREKEYEAKETEFAATKGALEKQVKDAASAKVKAAKDSGLKVYEPTEDNSVEQATKSLQDYLKQAPLEPKARRFKSNDSTVEKLGELLADNPQGLLVVRDELIGLLAAWERDGREGDRQFFLESWNGNQSFNTDRIKRGSIYIENLCLSLFGGIQPDKFLGYLEQAQNSLGNDGMIQRFQLLVYPDPVEWEYVDRAPNEEARSRAREIFHKLADFNPGEFGAEQMFQDRLPCFHFDEEAQEVFIQWSEELNSEKIPAEERDGSPLMAQHLAKYEKLFAGLALLFHLADCVVHGRKGPVSRGAAVRAGDWCELLEEHARRCYGLLGDGGRRGALTLGKKLREGKLRDGFTARDVSQKEWSGLSNERATQAALNRLERAQWIKGIEPDSGAAGRPTVRYSINPKIWKAAIEGPLKTLETPILKVLKGSNPRENSKNGGPEQ